VSLGLAEPISTSVEEPLYEIVNGERVELLPTSIYSNRIAARISFQMTQFVDQKSLGTVTMEALFILDAEADLRRRPDVAFVSAERWPLTREVPVTGDWQVVPDLAVEVSSPHDLFAELHGKVREYFDYGVRQVWIVIPDQQQVYIYSSSSAVEILNIDEELTGGDLLPGFRLCLRDLFRRSALALQSAAES
jgi:Uma2 family endonuclease